MFDNSAQDDITQESNQQLNQETNRGLALLSLLAVSVIGSSWLFYLPVYFDLKIVAQIFPLLFSIILLFTVTRLKHPILYKISSPTGFLVYFSCWAYVIYLNSLVAEEGANEAVTAQMFGVSNSMYILGLCLLILWLGRYFRFAVYLSTISIISFFILFFVLSSIQITYLIADFILLACCVIMSVIQFKPQTAILPQNHEVLDRFSEADMFLPSEQEEEVLVPELQINTLPLNEASVTHDWEMILRELHGELKNIPDVDQLFKSMLVFMHGAIEFDAAAVGMLQDKVIKKITAYGDEEFTHKQFLNWTNERVKQIFSSREPVLSQQSHLSASGTGATEPVHRLDVPVISNNKVLGLVSLFREELVFDIHDVQMVSSIVFHSMIALRQARLQEEVKRLSSETAQNKLTVYTREQFVAKVKPVLERVGKAREHSLFIVEIDHYDSIVDKYGRQAGAHIYKGVSKAIISQLSEKDLLGSYGKEGFIVLLDETDLIHAKAIAEKVRQKVSALKIKFQDSVITSTVSIGLTIVSDPDEDMPALMRKADMGLFVAKENGCNTIKVSL